jgi:hypothetical protein
VKKGGEVFITYGARAVFEMLLHYGFLPGLPLEYFEPSILLRSDVSDPLYRMRMEAIASCWPYEASDWRQIMPKYGLGVLVDQFHHSYCFRYLPVEVFQRAVLLQERRSEVLSNLTHVQEFICKSTSLFLTKDIESLRRNKRALLMVSPLLNVYYY